MEYTEFWNRHIKATLRINIKSIFININIKYYRRQMRAFCLRLNRELYESFENTTMIKRRMASLEHLKGMEPKRIANKILSLQENRKTNMSIKRNNLSHAYNSAHIHRNSHIKLS